jgi:hypothetical protein
VVARLGRESVITPHHWGWSVGDDFFSVKRAEPSVSESPQAAMLPGEKSGTMATSACIVTTCPKSAGLPLRDGSRGRHRPAVGSLRWCGGLRYKEPELRPKLRVGDAGEGRLEQTLAGKKSVQQGTGDAIARGDKLLSASIRGSAIFCGLRYVCG